MLSKRQKIGNFIKLKVEEALRGVEEGNFRIARDGMREAMAGLEDAIVAKLDEGREMMKREGWKLESGKVEEGEASVVRARGEIMAGQVEGDFGKIEEGVKRMRVAKEYQAKRFRG